MRTHLSLFSEDFVRAIQPLLEPLKGATESLAGASDATVRNEVLPQLRELEHQFRVLVDKVEDQHAFVLIFGPLKSGKSTLMNALAAAYVSEVSSLPAYPCMVYVSHAEERSFSATRYDGTTDVLEDAAALQLYVQRSHTELSAAIRRVEEEGEEFDPAVHFPQAIRRVDVKMPAGELESSGAVLVDTPGLYSRMKFGYSRMTREFRNSASCAIFVVKSDNLFLEQVFAEFSELLDLFSRIFLVLNVDSKKMDIGPRGELVPSVEQEEPIRIVEAFESFAMTAPLKRAAEEGRLRIYPIDLMRAARTRLQVASGATRDDDGATDDRATSFDVFQRELANFLNSTDYLIAFIQDSLRRSQVLLAELAALSGHESVRRMRQRLAELRSERTRTTSQREIVARLCAFAWDEAFQEELQRLSERIREHARKSAHATTSSMDAALERWFHSDASLQSLVEDELRPSLTQYQEGLSSYVQNTMIAEAQGLVAAVRMAPELAGQLRSIALSPDELARQGVQSVPVDKKRLAVPSPIQVDDVPVKKSFWDWVLFRSRASVRQRIFGPAENPTVRIAVHDKSARLGKGALDDMKRAIDRARGTFIDRANDSLRKGALADYERSLVTTIRTALEEKSDFLDARLDILATDIEELAAHCDRIEVLDGEAADARSRVERLEGKHARPELLDDLEQEDLADLVLAPVRRTTEGAQEGQGQANEADASGSVRVHVSENVDPPQPKDEA